MRGIITILLVVISYSIGQEVAVDSVWFREETNCDGANIVHMCYNISGDTVDVSIEASIDGGEKWNFPLVTRMNGEGDWGANVIPGTHCFDWIMSTDLPNTEMCEFALRIGAFSAGLGECIDLEPIDIQPWLDHIGRYPTGLTVMNGRIVFGEKCDDNKIYVINEARDTIERELISYSEYGWEDIAFDGEYIYGMKSISSEVVVYKIDTATAAIIDSSDVLDCRRGDGLVYDPINDCLWIAHHGWFLRKIETNTLTEIMHYNIEQADTGYAPNPEGLAYAYGMIWGVTDPSGYLGFYNFDSIWADTIFFEKRCRESGGEQGPEGLAFDGEYFLYANKDSHYIYRVKVFESESISISSPGCIDSRPPDVTIDAPEETDMGDECTISWHVEDMFWNNEPGTLYIDYCWRTDTIITDDTFHTWILPLSCDSVMIRIAVRDSFCNWGSDECRFHPGTVCYVLPNPFTPNGDGANDYAQFTYPKMYEIAGEIHIHNLYGRQVKRIDISMGETVKTKARWDGSDNDGNPLPQGVYLYVIESGGEVVCEGSVVIAR